MTNLINLTIDEISVQVPEGTTILEAAKKIGVKVPSLCYHPYLSKEGRCRICIVEVKGMRDLVASCAYPAAEGMQVITTNPEIRQYRRDIMELILDNHPDECHICERDSNCELQRLAYAMGVRHKHFKGEKKNYENDFSSKAVIREPNKCILCGRCVRMCSEIQGVNCLEIAHRGFKSVVVPAYETEFKDSICTSCGQCINVCPTAAFLEQDATQIVWKMLADEKKVKVAQFAPSVRAAIGEGFGLPAGTNMEKKVITALRMLGFDYVFDTQFGADLTIVEEASELIERITKGKKMPMITSCSAAWIKFVEQFYPQLLGNLSTCMSPMSMVGSVIKRYFAQKINRKPEEIFNVAAMCCTAKKNEAARDELKTEDGLPLVDAVITTRELVWMLKSSGIDLPNLPDGEFDSPLGESTGAATIFGATGGVMEAALRTAYFFLTGKEMPDLEYKPVREAIDYIKEAEVDINGTKVRVAVASSLGHAQTLLEKVLAGEKYDFIEIMGCLGGCVGGGGQPYAGTNMVPIDKELLKKRAATLYNLDEHKAKRSSHQNAQIQFLYQDALERYGSLKAHEWLHTHYKARSPKGVCRKPQFDKNIPASADNRLNELAAFMDQFIGQVNWDSYLVPVLQKAQKLFGYLAKDTMDFVSQYMQIPSARIYGVATFFHMFRLAPQGKYRFYVCMGTACYVKGAANILKELENQLGIHAYQTTADGLFTIEDIRCYGACGLAPVLIVNDKVYAKVKPEDVAKIVKEYREK
ncbi:MAG: NADH-dependent [FeFe] hydrogenase, group A6 [Candidatus Margulisiibacteriota bacterium]|jgi:iron-only hydrogenase group A